MSPDAKGTVSGFERVRTVKLVEYEVASGGLVVPLEHESVTVPHYIVFHGTCGYLQIIIVDVTYRLV